MSLTLHIFILSSFLAVIEWMTFRALVENNRISIGGLEMFHMFGSLIFSGISLTSLLVGMSWLIR